MKFKKQHRSIFLDPSSEKFALDEKVNVILSPAYYWVKRLTLPVKYVRDAKKLLPSIFEDTLNDGNYSYSVYKEGDYFFAFAYDDKVILDALEEKGISSSNIADVFFAQSEFSTIEGAFKISQTQSISLKDDVIVLLPSIWLEESKELDLESIESSKHSISLAQFGHIIDNKSLYKIGTLLAMLIVLVLVELFITNKKVDDVRVLKENLFTKAKLQSTMFQNKALLKKYQKIHTSQTDFRKHTSALLSLKLKPEEKLEAISLKNKKLTVSFNALSDASKKAIIEKLTSKKIKFEKKEKENSFSLEMKI